MIRWLAVAAALLACVVAQARADDLRPGYLEWSEQAPQHWRVTWKAPLLGGLATRARPSMPPGCHSSRVRRAFDGPFVTEVWEVRCAGVLAGKRLGLAGLEQGFTDALLRVAATDGSVQAARLTPDRPLVEVQRHPGRGEVAATYLRLGVEHILFGFDHLLFVVALVLLIGGPRRIVATITAFTVAHSLTLAAASLGAVDIARKPVEVCIALSIVMVAREVLRPHGAPPTLARRFPAAIAFVFGLLHGFGFAAALAEVGLPRDDLLLALLSFNVGVEFGQLAIVVGALVALAGLARAARGRFELIPMAGAYAIGAVASAWLIERMIA